MNNKSKLPIISVDSTKKLESFVTATLEATPKCSAVGVDTEFMWESTYFPKACLVQVANHSTIACIDPLSIDDLSALKSLLTNRDIVKIFHSGSQDMMLLQSLLGALPNSVFDTQIAASFLDMGEQISYAAMIDSLCSVTLDKSQSRTNWLKRPLSEAQIHYAADDVRYLYDAYEELSRRLGDSSKRSWVEQENAELVNPVKYALNDTRLLKTVKGSTSLKPEQQAIAQTLANWREQIAQEKNKPRRWILADALVMELAQQQPDTLQQLKQLQNIGPAQLKLAEQLLELVACGQNTASKSGHTTHIGPLSNEQKSLLKSIQELLRETAKKQSISPSLIGSRRSIENLIRGNREQPLLSSWRYELVGKEIEALLAKPLKKDG